tara:strand:+ start:7111 stop:7383 length:273 start_codon:yes stop_codon:yes gene_type:complete
MKKITRGDVRDGGSYKIIPFMLFLAYMFIDRMFALSFPYSISILSLMILISFFFFFKKRKDKEGVRFELIMLSTFALFIVIVLVYSLMLP